MNDFQIRKQSLEKEYEHLVQRKNQKLEPGNGIYHRYQFPILTAAHTPVFWRYDLHPERNPFLMERFGINAVFNAGAIKFKQKYYLVARVEGADRKSFFGIAESSNGIDEFRFWDYPLPLPESKDPDINVYDMRLIEHEDGWIYGVFCTERKDPQAGPHDFSSAIAQCGIVRTKDLKTWERLPDLKTNSPQQRNAVLHPELVNGKYAFYTRPQDGFISAGKGGGIAFGLCDSIEEAYVQEETILDGRAYHTISEVKNGLGPAPLKTEKGWLHLAHGVRNTAAGLRYVLYLFLTDLENPGKIIHKPAGYFLAPEMDERVGDVSNVLFANGWVADEDGRVLIYYASSDTRMHVASSSLEQLLDYVIHTPEDGLSSHHSLRTINQIIDANKLLDTNKALNGI